MLSSPLSDFLRKCCYFPFYRLWFLIFKPGNIKLHLGCGNNHKKGYINIDHRKTLATDLVCDIERLPFPDNSVDLIENYHVIEHLSYYNLKAKRSVIEWFRVLKPGGKLIIECPDFDKSVQEYLEGNENRLQNIFGKQRFKGDAHLFGYNFERLKRLLEECGFASIVKTEAQDYHIRKEPCFRVEAEKPISNSSQ